MGIRSYIGIFLALAILATIGGLTVSRNYWKGEAVEIKEQTVVATARIGRALGNDKLKWKDVPEQVERYADGHDQLVIDTGIANAQVQQISAEADRLRALNAELREKAKVEIVKRNRLIAKLDNDALTPGDKENLQEQIGAVVAALDAIYEEDL